MGKYVRHLKDIEDIYGKTYPKYVEFLKENKIVDLNKAECYKTDSKSVNDSSSVTITSSKCNLTSEITTVYYVTIKNNSGATIKDITVCCDWYAPSGTHIDSSCDTLYDSIASGASKNFHFDSLTHSQAKQYSCSVKTRFGGKGYN
ncbi:MAG: hypothetical protein L6Q54_04160 [Leptospiraceae bacterium]|nr:hypothetical protein [Leptospiraceae bacterium]MCK6380429.1 hypothetical protein [Leptospiraceae bacterium]NUM41904.1 hypothetical protein [Leptospiraceae bacterium]